MELDIRLSKRKIFLNFDRHSWRFVNSLFSWRCVGQKWEIS
jgi:hypothetical protein